MFGRLGLGVGLFVGSLALGWALRRRGWLTEAQAKRVIRLTMRWLSPVVLCLSFWRLHFAGAHLAWLPVIGFAVSSSTLLPAWWYARRAQLSPPQTGSFLTCALFSNLGFLGAFIAFALYGEAAYGLAMLYLVYFSPSFYLLGFAIAKRLGRGTSVPRHSLTGEDLAGSVGQDRRPSTESAEPMEELRLYPFLGLLTGVVLNLAHVPRPAICEPINRLLIPVDTAIYLTAVGTYLRVESLGPWRQAGLAMSAIKFCYSPLIGWALVWLTRLEGLPRFIVLLQTSMPVALSPLMLTMLFGLDRRLATALFLMTTCLAIPWLFLYVPLIR